MDAAESVTIALLAGILFFLIDSTVCVVILAAHALESSWGKNAAWSKRRLGPWIRFKTTRLATQKIFENLSDKNNGSLWAFIGNIFDIWETECQLPVIFLTNPQEANGPVGDVPIWHVDGSRVYVQSLSDVYTAIHQGYSTSKDQESINLGAEAASWLTLLQAVESMELQSKEWEQSRWEDAPYLGVSIERRLVVAFQRKTYIIRKNSGFRKPYAITTLAYIIELAAILGIYWKVFDRERDLFRADGNGFCLYGWRESSLGFCFKFEQVGLSKHRWNRIIPTISMRPLCFGFVPTIWSERDMWGYRDLENQGMDNVLVDRLRLDSWSAIAKILRLVGCDTATIGLLEENNQYYRRLFPVAFELVGMLGQTMHILNRPYTYIPNPTIYVWSQKLCSFRKLLDEFQNRRETVEKLMDGELSRDMKPIFHLATAIGETLPREQGKKCYTLKQLNSLHEAINRADDILARNEERCLLVVDVLRQHLQALAYEGLEYSLFKGPVEEKEKRFMDVYFNKILRKVSKRKDDANEEQDATRVLVWCALMFRMICWFLLHDIDEGDVQLRKGDLLDSQIPAFIE